MLNQLNNKTMPNELVKKFINKFLQDYLHLHKKISKKKSSHVGLAQCMNALADKVTVCMALLICVLCQPVHSCIDHPYMG